jgi:ABC-2 type transport system ATP-binding protein
VTSNQTVIAIQNLTKTYRGGLLGNRSIAALRQVSLETYRGEVFGLLGPNGAGKTTLIKILLGVIRASGGSARVFGHPAGSIAARSHVGYLPESLRIDRHHTARTALVFYGGMSRLDRPTIAKRSPELLRLVGLEGRDRESVRRFSKGMYQRLGLAQALLHDPDLLILDEPTDGLDPVGRSEVRRLLLELKGRGKTIFLNSHILQEVELVCDRVAIMASGQIRGVGTIDDLTEQLGNRTVRLELAATWSDDQVRHVLSEAIGVSDPSAADTQSPAPLQMVRIGNHTWRVNIPWRDQASIDRLVDRLRQADISILSLTTPKRTLEDVFLSLVGSVPIDQELGAPLLDAGSLDARLDLDRNTAEGVPDRTAAAMLSSTDNDPQQRDRQQRSPVGQVSPVRGGTS